MNLLGIASGLVNAVNPYVTAAVQASTGSTQNADYTRTPTYSTRSVQCQVQPIDGDDLKMIDAVNLQGVSRKIYVVGSIEGVLRPAARGGDLVVFPAGTPGVPEGLTWLAVQQIEQWPDWCTVLIRLQNGA